jgi:hypothetical protein
MRRRTSPASGVLVVYSERYISEDSGTPGIYRRPVKVYNDKGQLVANEPSAVGDSPARIRLAPGRYVAVSESLMRLRKVEVDVQDGRQTMVTELSLEEAPLFSSQPERPTQMAAY